MSENITVEAPAAAGQALEVRRTTVDNAPARPKTLTDQVWDMQEQFQYALPSNFDAGQLCRDIITSIKRTKNLDRCDAMSIIGSAMSCAQLGLRPGVLGQAWILPYWQGGQGHVAQLVIGYQGYVELAYRTGMIASIIARTVGEAEPFDVEYGLNERLVHKPLFDEAGPASKYYAIVKYNGGGHHSWVMSHQEALEHRDRFAPRNKQKQIVGPWRDHFEPMAWKTCLLKLSKWMPKSPEYLAALRVDGSIRRDADPDADPVTVVEHPVPLDTDQGAEAEPAAGTQLV